ncbi:hypothetical protein M2334_001697 [Sphingobium sp. B11D3D]|nr:hypothetical protein [Sphingobium sp. B12D2B]MCW2369498.1 hypothetical protein [Sphingobium sp. B11D3D]
MCEDFQSETILPFASSEVEKRALRVSTSLDTNGIVK